MKKTDTLARPIWHYQKSLSSIIKKVEKSKHKAITTVNKFLIELYWFIGQCIVNLQEKSKWGDSVIEKLSQDLKMRFPEMSGFSVQNLWYMRKMYLSFQLSPILQTMSGELSWSNNVIILDKTKSIEEKEFYLRMAIQERWSSRELQRQIDSAYFERDMLSQKPSPIIRTKQQKLMTRANDVHKHLKDEYILEFLDLSKTFFRKRAAKSDAR
jgi:predicted nuclease of restriction endonuclease-like (RecB) superfamily